MQHFSAETAKSPKQFTKRKFRFCLIIPALPG